MKIQKIRGTTDLYGEKIQSFNRIISIVKNLSELYSFNEISTPIIENSEVFHRTLGATCDIVRKETYSFIDRDKTSITLRPEFTASIIRAVISNNMLQSKPLRLFSYGPLFRHERPQKCRLRQFNQINFEYIGLDSHKADIELIMLATDILEGIMSLDKTSLKVNTLGNTECRTKFKDSLRNYLSKYKNDLSETSLIRLEKNPLRILDSKDEKEQDILKQAPSLYNFLDYDSKKNFEEILMGLEKINISYSYDRNLVRGMDYYSGFVFEFVTKTLGSQGTVIAGGRYNNLILEMGGVETPSVGFAGGVERLVELSKLPSVREEPEYIRTICLIPIGKLAEDKSLGIIRDFRKKGIAIWMDHGFTLKKRLQRANSQRAKFSIIFGENELIQDKYILKDMFSGEETTMSMSLLVKHLKNYLNFL